MLPLDSYVQKRARNRHHRSETELRLYWSTYQKMADQASARHKKSPMQMGIRRLLGALRRWWPESVQPDKRVGQAVPRAQPFTSKEGKV